MAEVLGTYQPPDAQLEPMIQVLQSVQRSQAQMKQTIQTQTRRIEYLTTENDALRQEVQRLQDANDALQRGEDALQQEVQRLKDANDALLRGEGVIVVIRDVAYDLTSRTPVASVDAIQVGSISQPSSASSGGDSAMSGPMRLSPFARATETVFKPSGDLTASDPRSSAVTAERPVRHPLL